MYLHLLIYEVIIARAIVAASVNVSTTVATLGESIVLNCSLSNNVSKKAWTRPSKDALFLHNGSKFNTKALNVNKFSVVTNESSYNLMIINISKQEEGLFCCSQVINNYYSIQLCTDVHIDEGHGVNISHFHNENKTGESVQTTMPNTRSFKSDTFSKGLVLYIAFVLSGIVAMFVATFVYVKCRKIKESKNSKKNTVAVTPSNQHDINTGHYSEIEIIEPNERNESRLMIID